MSRARAPTCACRCARSRSRRRRRCSAARTMRRSASTTPPARTPIRMRGIDLAAGLAPLRARWIEERSDTELLAAPEFRIRPRPRTRRAPGRRALPQPARCRAAPRPAPTCRRCTTRGAASSPRRWNSSPSARTSASTRSATRDLLAAASGRELRRAASSSSITPEFVRDEIARGRAIMPEQHQPSRKRADDHRPQLPDQDQRQHRQLRGVVRHRRGSREAGVGDPLGRATR